MRQLVILSFVISLLACGTESSASVAEIGWLFNYKDYTDATKPDDIRGCDNQPASASGPAYDAITTMHVLIVDPAGQVAGVNREYACDLGTGDKRIPIRGIAKQEYKLTLEAKNAGGDVLYRYTLDKYDISTLQSESYNMPTATGELHFFPRFQSSLTCPNDVAKLRYSLYKKTNGTPDTAASVTGVAEPACEQGFSGLSTKELSIRGIPVVIEPGSYQTYNDFELELEALSASDSVLHCRKNPSRTVRPGNNSVGGDESLSPGACP
jgi:hypothetical protein